MHSHFVPYHPCFHLTLPPPFQLDRLMSRDQSTREEALQRVKAQLPTREKVAHELTTDVIWNNGTQEELRGEVTACLSRLRGKVTTFDKILTLPGRLSGVRVATTPPSFRFLPTQFVRLRSTTGSVFPRILLAPHCMRPSSPS